MKKRIALSLALALLVTGCSRTQSSQSGTLSPGGRVNAWTIPHVLRYATGEDFSSLNPLLSQQTTLSLMASLTMAWLIKWDRHDKPYPELLTQIPTMRNGGVSKDGRTITYHLRKGVVWSDGVPFTADDVVWTIHAILNPANDVVSRSGWDRITSIGEPDKYTVVLHLSKPYSPFIETFFSTAGANPCVLPEHLLARYPNINHVAYNSLPIGIGPFKYKAWERGQKVVMVPNPRYFRGLPKLKEIDFEIISDTNTILTQLQAKELDMWYNVPGNYVQRVQALTPFKTFVQPNYYFRHFDFNLSSRKLRDPAVREALRYATDRQAIIAKIYQGLGVLQEEPAPKISAYWDPKIQPVPFDIAKANALLDAAGWKRGSDGVRAKNGVRLSLDFVSATGAPVNDEVIELVRGWWKQIGVQINVRHYLESLFFAPYQDGGILYGGKFDVVYFAWGLDPIGDFSNLYACDQIPPNGQNDVRWCNKTADKAMHDLYTHYDQAQRNADDAIVQEQLVKDVPTVVIMGTQLVWAENRDLKHFHPGAISPFDNMMDVDI